MSTSADSAEQVVKISLDGAEYALRFTGEAVKKLTELVAFIAAVLKDNANNSPGKKTLTQMIRDGKPIQFFELPAKDLKTFAEQAKKYGVFYHAMNRTPDNPNAVIDLMVRQEDAPKINRIIDRFQLAAVNNGKLETEQPEPLSATKEEAAPEELELGVQEKTENERLLDEILAPKENGNRNPMAAKTEPAAPSEPFSKGRDSAGKDKKPSVREHLKEIKDELAAAKSEAPEIKVPQVELKLPETSR